MLIWYVWFLVFGLGLTNHYLCLKQCHLMPFQLTWLCNCKVMSTFYTLALQNQCITCCKWGCKPCVTATSWDWLVADHIVKIDVDVSKGFAGKTVFFFKTQVICVCLVTDYFLLVMAIPFMGLVYVFMGRNFSFLGNGAIVIQGFPYILASVHNITLQSVHLAHLWLIT